MVAILSMVILIWDKLGMEFSYGCCQRLDPVYPRRRSSCANGCVIRCINQCVAGWQCNFFVFFNFFSVVFLFLLLFFGVGNDSRLESPKATRQSSSEIPSTTSVSITALTSTEPSSTILTLRSHNTISLNSRMRLPIGSHGSTSRQTSVHEGVRTNAHMQGIR